jgi:hypothetical protein
MLLQPGVALPYTAVSPWQLCHRVEDFDTAAGEWQNLGCHVHTALLGLLVYISTITTNTLQEDATQDGRRAIVIVIQGPLS